MWQQGVIRQRWSPNSAYALRDATKFKVACGCLLIVDADLNDDDDRRMANDPDPGFMLEAALRYVRYGWPVMPLAGVSLRDGTLACTCPAGAACASPGKHPRTSNGLMDATTNAAVVEGWFQSFGNLNIGIRTGVVCDVLDLDAGGWQSLARWMRAPELASPDETVLSLWSGPVVRTGNGYHLFIQPSRVGNRAHLLPAIDYRSDGGYIVAAPSLHVSGRRYEWIRKGKLVQGQLPAIPDWLHDLLNPATCPFILRSGRVCAKSGSHQHGDLVFTSSIAMRMAGG
jgi:hypothetical protein